MFRRSDGRLIAHIVVRPDTEADWQFLRAHIEAETGTPPTDSGLVALLVATHARRIRKAYLDGLDAARLRMAERINAGEFDLPDHVARKRLMIPVTHA